MGSRLFCDRCTRDSHTLLRCEAVWTGRDERKLDLVPMFELCLKCRDELLEWLKNPNEALDPKLSDNY